LVTSFWIIIILFLLYALEKQLREATISLVKSVRPTVRMEQGDWHRKDCNEISYLLSLLTFVDSFPVGKFRTKIGDSLRENLCVIKVTFNHNFSS
jgi:tRNA(Ile)-lysidine synthase TilS/MesJ